MIAEAGAQRFRFNDVETGDHIFSLIRHISLKSSLPLSFNAHLPPHVQARAGCIRTAALGATGMRWNFEFYDLNN
jgi:hypothetical protein